MIQIIPAILAKNEEDFERELRKIEESGDFEWIHVDFCDGKLVPNKTVGIDVLKKFSTKLKIEAHLMVENPEEWVSGLSIDRVITHKEIGDQRIGEGQFGLAFNPETPISGQLDDLDCILIMGIHPGFQGQEFLPEVLEKVKESSRIRSDSNSGFLVGVDGGVDSKNVREIVEAGVDYLIIGSHLIRGDIDENYKKIKESLKDS